MLVRDDQHLSTSCGVPGGNRPGIEEGGLGCGHCALTMPGWASKAVNNATSSSEDNASIFMAMALSICD